MEFRDGLRGTTKLTKAVLTDCGFQNITDHDIEVVQYVSAMISQRAAVLVSITTSDIVKRIYEKDLTIAIDGSVYKKHPRMKGWLNRLIECFNTSGKTVSLLLAEDASGKGAALTAAIALRLLEEETCK